MNPDSVPLSHVGYLLLRLSKKQAKLAYEEVGPAGATGLILDLGNTYIVRNGNVLSYRSTQAMKLQMLMLTRHFPSFMSLPRAVQETALTLFCEALKNEGLADVSDLHYYVNLAEALED